MVEEYVCDLCTAVFYNRNDIEQHWRKHLFADEADEPKQQLKSVKNDSGGNLKFSFSISHLLALLKGKTRTFQKSLPKKFDCSICQIPINNCFESETHIENETVEMKYQCLECFCRLESLESLESHRSEKRCYEFKILDIGDIVRVAFECSMCGLQFESDDLMEKHYLQSGCRKKIVYNYTCGKCNAVFEDFNEWSVHEESHLERIPFYCVICLEKFRCFFAYRRHIRGEHNSIKDSEAFLCSICNKSFGSTSDRIKHEEEKHMDTQPFKCFSCNKGFYNLSHLNRHKSNCHSGLGSGKSQRQKRNINTEYGLGINVRPSLNHSPQIDLIEGRCFICNKQLKSEVQFNHHVAGHLGLLQCKFCNKSFQNYDLLSAHRPCHASPFSCERCNENYPNVSSLNTHRYVCKRQPRKVRYKKENWNFQCEICGCLKVNLSRLEQHNRQLHKKRNHSYQCETCKSNHDSMKGLMRHRYDVHGDPKQYTCARCQRTFVNGYSLKVHLKSVHAVKEDKFPCNKCGRKFATKSLLRIHYNVHMADTKPYKCELCDVRFTQRCNLNKHRVIHTGAKPYKCDVCHIAYNHRSSLLKHKYIHTGNFPFKCEYCSQGFSQQRCLLEHRKRHEGLSKYTKTN